MLKLRPIATGLAVAILVALTVPVGAMAVESKGVTKGSFRDLYPDAILIDHDDVNNVVYTGTNIGAGYGKSYQFEYKDFRNEMEEYARKICEGKSSYAIVDKFEVAAAFHSNGALLFTATCNAICFNLPVTPSPKPSTKK